MSGFEKFNERFPTKDNVIVYRLKISDKEYEYVFKVWDRFKIKRKKDYHDLDLK